MIAADLQPRVAGGGAALGRDAPELGGREQVRHAEPHHRQRALLMPPDRSTVLARYATVLGLLCALALIVRAAQWVLFLNGEQSHWPLIHTN